MVTLETSNFCLCDFLKSVDFWIGKGVQEESTWCGMQRKVFSSFIIDVHLHLKKSVHLYVVCNLVIDLRD